MDVPLNTCNPLFELHVTGLTIKGITWASDGRDHMGWEDEPHKKCASAALKHHELALVHSSFVQHPVFPILSGYHNGQTKIMD